MPHVDGSEAMTPSLDDAVRGVHAEAARAGTLLEPTPIEQGRRRVASPVALVERAQAGDQQAFERLYRLQFPGIARQVAALVRDPDRTEDTVAQTFLLAWRDLPTLRRVDRFDSWLARIAHNQAMSELRRRRTAPLEDAPEPEDPSDLDRPDAAFALRASADAVHAALIELPDDQRQVLVLRFIRDLPHSETARLLGRSEQATRALQYRALRSMHQIMGGDGSLSR